MVIGVGLRKYNMDLDNLYLETLLSSLVLLNTRMCLLFKLKA